MSRRSWLLFAAMCVIWGIPYLLIRIAVREITPGTVVFLRTAVGGLVLLPVALHVGGFRAVARRWRALLAFSVLEMAVPWLLLSSAEQRLSSSLTGLLIAAVPLVSVVAAFLLRSDERADGWQLVGLLVGLIGVAMLVGLDLGALHVGSLLEILVVVIGYATAPMILARRLSDLPSIPVVCASLLLVAAGYLPYAALRIPHGVPAQGWWSIAVLGLVCTALAFVVFFALIAQIGPSRSTVITYVNPAVAVLCGVAFLGERFTVGMAVGFPLILLGSVLGARRRPARVAAAAPVPEAAVCELVEPGVGEELDQSMRTGPDGVSNSAATRPGSPSVPSQSTSMPSSG